MSRAFLIKPKLITMEYIKISDQLPPNNVVVMTKIDDGKNIRNEQKLIRQDNLYWHADKSMYVYYTPTHWKPIED